ncbi:hypothetical protein ACP70R_045559 [Stipagrostis hirtigluma subsp. patula]
MSSCLSSLEDFLSKRKKENYSIDDSDWDEVRFINGYAVFMGYLLMGVRGLGILVVTWTTVVLLGGYVSVLGKDFWCLTGITLVQTAGVFNFLLQEKLKDIVHLCWGLLGAIFATVTFREDKDQSAKKKDAPPRKRLVVANVLSVIQLLVLAIILCPLAVLYMLGLYISTGVSLWRLVEHDFGYADGGANLKPALEVLYSLVVAQGVLFGYKTIHSFGAELGLAKFVSDVCSVDKKLVAEYLDKMVEGCEKDPSFATGKNLITYATDLMLEPKSTDGFIAGVRALGKIIKNGRQWGHPVLAKHLLTRSASCSHVILRLLETLGPRSPYGSEIGEHAAEIVVLVAHSIHLEQHPGGIECISSLLAAFEEYSWLPEYYMPDRDLPNEYERDWLLADYERYYDQEYKRGRSRSTARTSPESDGNQLQGYSSLVIQRLRILQELAVHEDNRRVISNTEGLLSKITMLPLSSGKLHRDDHEAWWWIVSESCKLKRRLIPDPGETAGTKPRGEVSSNNCEAITSPLETILQCCRCSLLQKAKVIAFLLLDQSVDISSIHRKMPSESSSRMLLWIMLLVFLEPEYFFYMTRDNIHQTKKINDIISLSFEAVLSSQSEGSATSMLQSVCVVLGDLTRTLVGDGDNTNRVYAAKILEHLVRYYTKDDEYLKELKKAMVDVMPKVLKEMLGYGPTGEEIQIVIEGNNVKLSAPSTDLKNGGVSQGNGHEDTSSSHQQNGDQHGSIILLEALYDLCKAIKRKWIDTDTDVTRELNEIAKKVCPEQENPVKDFKGLVDEARELLKKYTAEELARVRAASSSRETCSVIVDPTAMFVSFSPKV